MLYVVQMPISLPWNIPNITIFETINNVRLQLEEPNLTRIMEVDETTTTQFRVLTEAMQLDKINKVEAVNKNFDPSQL